MEVLGGMGETTKPFFFRSPAVTQAGRFLATLQSFLCTHVIYVHMTLRYSPSELLGLHKKPCLCVSRTVRRRLVFFYIYVKHIPVRISSRSSATQSTAPKPSNRHLRCVPRAPVTSSRRNNERIPSLLLSNVCSISNKLDESQMLISNLRPDIVVFVETWLHGEIPDDAVSIPEYAVFRHDRNSVGGGILCYISNAYSAYVIDLIPVSLLVTCKTEMLAIFVKEIKVLVIAVYHFAWNNNAVHEEALSLILEAIDSFLCNPEFPCDAKIILCGDFNDLRKFSNRITDCTSLLSYVNVPTRRNNSLDLIFSNYISEVNAVLYPPIGHSDHSVVFWRPGIVKKNKSFVKKVVRKLSRANVALFREKVACTDWLAMVKSEQCLDSSTSMFLSTLKFLFDLCFPQKTVRIRSSDPVWMSSSLKLLMNARDEAWHNKKWLKYRRLRDEVTEHIKKAKASFLRRASSSGSGMELWKVIKGFGRASKPVSSASIRYTSDVSAQDLSEHFSSVFGSYSLHALDDIPHLMNDLPSLPITVSVHEIEVLLSQMKKKSPGPDGIPSWVLRDLSFCFAPAVAYIFNRSFSEGHVPLCLKEAMISPIPKTPKPSTADSFRPISLLPLLSKVLERIVVRRWFLPCVRNLDCSQFAYIPRPGSGCSSALTLLQHSILSFLDQGSGAVRLLALDYSKAFDKLPHASIVKSCVRCHIPVEAVRWVISYLKDRQQCVRYEASLSSWHSPESGVPQGSILGPILFCAVLSSLCPLHVNSKMIKYADDISLLHFIRTSSEDRLEDEFQHVISWSEGAGLQLNLSKCSVTNFVTSRSLSCGAIHDLSGTALQMSHTVKILGVTFSDDFKWNVHFENVVRKASKRIFVIRNLKRSGCDDSILYNVYVALIRSVLLYCYPSFCNAPAYLHKMLLRVEKRIFKIIFGSHQDVFKGDILTAAENMCSAFFMKVHDTSEHPLRGLFCAREPSRSNTLTLCPPKTKTKRFSSSFIKFCKPLK